MARANRSLVSAAKKKKLEKADKPEGLNPIQRLGAATTRRGGGWKEKGAFLLPRVPKGTRCGEDRNLDVANAVGGLQ